MSLLLAASAVRQQAPAGGGAGIAYVGKGTFSTATNTDTLALALDAGHSTGDLLIAIVALRPLATFDTGPDGTWSELQEEGGASGPDGAIAVWYKFADGTEGATGNFVASGSVSSLGGICLAYSGVASVADTSANDLRSNSTFQNYTGTLPTVAAGDWLVSYIGTGVTSAVTFTEPSGTTEIHDQGGSQTEAFAVAHEGPLASAPSAQNWTPSGAITAVRGPILLKAA